jgi:uncharacterized protein YukJ
MSEPQPKHAILAIVYSVLPVTGMNEIQPNNTNSSRQSAEAAGQTVRDGNVPAMTREAMAAIRR